MTLSLCIRIKMNDLSAFSLVNRYNLIEYPNVCEYKRFHLVENNFWRNYWMPCSGETGHGIDTAWESATWCNEQMNK